jgi:pyridoxamine 5'-phosphate oxidase
VNPLAEFRRWFDEAVSAGEREPDAMALATVSPDGRPSVRYVLVRGVEEGAIRFFTNLESRKAREIAANPHAAAVFLWPILGRQVRIEGTLEAVADVESDVYFATRPRSHQIASWASPQSRPLPHDELVRRYAEIAQRYDGQVIPRPPFWGGFSLSATSVEFWERRPNRLHRRVLWSRVDGVWASTEIAP